MKVETREVTIKQSVYISCDDKVFMSEDECCYHEYELCKAKLQCYDDNCNKCEFDSCVYVKLITEDDVNDLKAVCRYDRLDTEGIKGVGIYMYTEHGDWINITDVVSNIYGGK